MYLYSSPTVCNFFRINTEKGKATLDFTANVTLKAHYNMDGQVLILPIRGNGAAKIKISEYLLLDSPLLRKSFAKLAGIDPL